MFFMKIFSPVLAKIGSVPAVLIERNAPRSLFRGWRLTQTQSSVTGMKTDEAKKEQSSVPETANGCLV
ncbi:MAG: hypothetical protein AUJ60_05615 [Nitrospirae bacterium CG1_02_44_142]|nr:MAG: hypothetical protein AUJ60_05615 [Nitrospirae bacterium CG1_02_44_142]